MAVARNPSDWLAAIERLAATGEKSAARTELESFRKAYPEYPVPSALEKLLARLAANKDEAGQKLLQIRKKLENMPLSSFTVADFEALYRVVGCDIHKDPREEDLVRLEKKV